MQDAGHRASRHSDIDLAQRQLQAIDAFNRSRAAAERAARSAHLSREMRMGSARRLETLRRQHDAIVRRTDEQLRLCGDLLYSTAELRAVIAHSNTWFRDKLCLELERREVRVVAGFSCAAAALGTSVAEQPDMVLVGDPLSAMTGAQFLRELAQLSPKTLLAAQVANPEDVEELVEAGARAVFTRAVPPGDVAAHLADVLTDVPRQRDELQQVVERSTGLRVPA